MILACPACDSRYDVTGHAVGQKFRCRCGQMMTLEAMPPVAGELACPRTEIRAVPAAGQKMYLPCPMCHVVMNRKLFATGTGVIIDVCRTHGTFFDAGELPLIIDFVMNGGLERAQIKDIERMREAA